MVWIENVAHTTLIFVIKRQLKYIISSILWQTFPHLIRSTFYISIIQKLKMVCIENNKTYFVCSRIDHIVNNVIKYSSRYHLRCFSYMLLMEIYYDSNTWQVIFLLFVGYLSVKKSIINDTSHFAYHNDIYI